MRQASALADSPGCGEIEKGLADIAEIVSGSSGSGIEFGFVDNALFLARKHASSGDAAVRRAVINLLLSVGKMGPSWREAALETADEIRMQPSLYAGSVASEVVSELTV
jgi:hypothetical protein